MAKKYGRRSDTEPFNEEEHLAVLEKEKEVAERDAKLAEIAKVKLLDLRGGAAKPDAFLSSQFLIMSYARKLGDGRTVGGAAVMRVGGGTLHVAKIILPFAEAAVENEVVKQGLEWLVKYQSGRNRVKPQGFGLQTSSHDAEVVKATAALLEERKIGRWRAVELEKRGPKMVWHLGMIRLVQELNTWVEKQEKGVEGA